MLFGGDMSTLEHLIHPMSRQEFFGYYTNQSPLWGHRRRGAFGNFGGDQGVEVVAQAGVGDAGCVHVVLLVVLH